MAGSINNIDTMLKRAGLGLRLFLKSPVTGGCSRCDRDASLLLLFHPVHRSSTFVRFTDLVVDAGVVQNTLRQCCFSRVDMGHDTDVSGPLKRVFSSCHLFPPLDGLYQKR